MRTIAIAAAAALAATAVSATAASLITSAQIKDGTILARDLSPALRAQLAKAGQPGLAGAQGPQGLRGETGEKGEPGQPDVPRCTGTDCFVIAVPPPMPVPDPSDGLYYRENTMTVQANDAVATVFAKCDDEYGDAVISGGYQSATSFEQGASSTLPDGARVISSRVIAHRGSLRVHASTRWAVQVDNRGGPAFDMTVYITCKAGAAYAALQR